MFVYVFQYFLKETNNFFWNFAWTFRAKYPVVLIHVHVQILISCFRTCHYTQGSFIEDLYLLLSIANFCLFLCLLSAIQLLHINVFTVVFGITPKAATQKTSHSISSSTGSHFEAFLELILVDVFLFLRAVPSYLLKFCTYFFCITLLFNVLRQK